MKGQDCLNGLTSFDLTHVLFEKEDDLGWLLAGISLLPIGLLLIYVTAFISRRDISPLVALVGQILCEALNYALKKYIKHTRPTACRGKGYGMPSSHAQFMGYAAVYFSLYLYYRITFETKFWKHLLSVMFFSVALIVCYSRVYLLYHSWAQVSIGVVLGGLFGGAWFWLNDRLLRTTLYPYLLSSKWAAYFYLKDNSNIRNVHSFEYGNWTRHVTAKHE